MKPAAAWFGAASLALASSAALADVTIKVSVTWDDDDITLFVGEGGAPVTVHDGDVLGFKVVLQNAFRTGNSDGQALSVPAVITQIEGPDLGPINPNEGSVGFRDYPDNQGNPRVDELNVSWGYTDGRTGRTQWDFPEDTVSIPAFNPVTGFTDGTIQTTIDSFLSQVPTMAQTTPIGLGSQIGSLFFDLSKAKIELLDEPCQADVNGDGVADQGDIQAYVAAFLAQDLAADFNGDGIVDLGDIQVFVGAFLGGC